MSDTRGTEAIGTNAADLKAVGDAARQVGDKAAQAGGDAVQQAKVVAEEARDRASSLLSAAGEKATSLAEEHKHNVAGYLDDVAKAVHRSGEQMEGHQDWIAHMVERGADELGALANTLRTNDLQSLLGELGSLARRQPALFVGASMAAGFALARVGRVAASGVGNPAATAPHAASSATSLPATTSTPVPTRPGMPQPETSPLSLIGSPSVAETSHERE